MPFQAEKKAMKNCLAKLGALSPRELDNGIFKIDVLTSQRSAVDAQNARRAILEKLLFRSIKRLYPKHARPSKVTLVFQESGKQTPGGIFKDCLVRVVWNDSEEDMKFPLELPRSVGELFKLTRHNKLRASLSAPLPSELVYCIRILDLDGVRRVGPGYDDAMTAAVSKLLRPALEKVIGTIAENPDAHAWFSEYGVYPDDIVASLEKLA